MNTKFDLTSRSSAPSTLRTEAPKQPKKHSKGSVLEKVKSSISEARKGFAERRPRQGGRFISKKRAAELALSFPAFNSAQANGNKIARTETTTHSTPSALQSDLTHLSSQPETLLSEPDELTSLSSAVDTTADEIPGPWSLSLMAPSEEQSISQPNISSTLSSRANELIIAQNSASDTTLHRWTDSLIASSTKRYSSQSLPTQSNRLITLSSARDTVPDAAPDEPLDPILDAALNQWADSLIAPRTVLVTPSPASLLTQFLSSQPELAKLFPQPNIHTADTTASGKTLPPSSGLSAIAPTHSPIATSPSRATQGWSPRLFAQLTNVSSTDETQTYTIDLGTGPI